MAYFNKKYFAFTVALFIIEILIALYVHDRFIRPYVGDVLVVILIYCFVKSFFHTPPLATAVGVLLFAFFVETLQYFDICGILGVSDSRFFSTVIGNYFSWVDIVTYIVGFLIIIIAENIRARTGSKSEYTNSR